MSLDTVLHTSLGLAQTYKPDRPLCALVLMGGGARTAYQVGVLQAMASMLDLQPNAPKRFPFQILVGTSAGALNATYLAGSATSGLKAFDQLAQFWIRLRSSDIYELNVSPWVNWAGRASKLLAALSLSRNARRSGAILNNMPLVNTLHRAISLPGIDQALANHTLEVLAVTASSYTSGVHWTFCHTAHDAQVRPWNRPGRRAEFQPITIEHLMASSAIPFIFPSGALWVDGGREFFGDGSMRQISPLSPALHLGAQKVLVVGVGQPQRSGMTGAAVPSNARMPSLGAIAGHAMASVFHDTLQADVELAQRVNNTLRQLPRDVADALPYRGVEVMSIQPSQSLDALAQKHRHELPAATRNALSGLGALKGGAAAVASYLLFEPGFVQALMALGEHDAYANKEQLLAFFS
ncbi:MAG TPA: patatin-like phospholipase family protein [Burkholderiaceae bacterium]|nr:patatin-like phospholipase family protein [Burkholderiaceae bacterium]